jgi:hypothetical protein
MILIPASVPPARRLPRSGRPRSGAPANQISALQNTISDLDFPSLSTEDREMVTETLTSLKNIVDEALVRAAKKS